MKKLAVLAGLLLAAGCADSGNQSSGDAVRGSAPGTNAPLNPPRTDGTSRATGGSPGGGEMGGGSSSVPGGATESTQ